MLQPHKGLTKSGSKIISHSRMTYSIFSFILYSSFSGEPSPGSSIRYVETQSMQIGASYSLQFSLVMGCGREPSPHIDTQVRLEFSTNHGLTWHLVKEVRSLKHVPLSLPCKVIADARSPLFAQPGSRLCLQPKLVEVILERATRKHIIYS